MPSDLVVCDGLTLGSLQVPAFRLSSGQAVCLHMPAMAHGESDDLIRILTGQKVVQQFQIASQVMWAGAPNNDGRTHPTWPSPLSLWERFWFGSPLALDWLMRTGGLPEPRARAILAEHDIPLRLRIHNLPGNPRTFLSLEAAWARGAEVVVFTTAGLDPLGVQKIFQMVSAHLPRCAAIYLSTPFICNGQTGRSCLPGAVCLEVRQAGEQILSPTP
jgi:hypothetical protein